MAEFCVDCLQKIMETDYPANYFRISRELNFCEECRQWTRVVVSVRLRYRIAEWWQDFRKHSCG